MPVSDFSLAKVTTEKIFVSADLELQMQPQAVPVSDLSLAKVTTEKIFVSTDLDPDLDPVQAIDPVFSKTSKFFTPLQCDIEPETNNPTSKNIDVSSNLSPDPSSDLASRKIVLSSDLDPDLDPVQEFA